jgi:bifunctional UDP-N-acetylglucosamine pyrophosphorylase / glucosamine-1-phosphate N-acetyltransferase
METIISLVLAAGKGVRMQSERPKVLHKLCGQALLGYVIKAAQEIESQKVYVITRVSSDSIHEAFPDNKLDWIFQGEPKGTGHALMMSRQALADFNGLLMVLCGDAPLITAVTLKHLLAEHQKVKHTACTVLTCDLDNPGSYGRVLRDNKGRVTGIIESSSCTEKQKKIKEINSGMYIFDARSLFGVLAEIKPNNKSGEYYLTDVVACLVKHGKSVAGYKAHDAQECLGINSREELVLAEEIMQKRIKHQFIKSGITIIDPANTYIESGVSIGQDTTIEPFTVIRRGVTIGRFCHVGPFSQLRDGTVLEDYAEVGNFTEVKRSRLGKYTKAKHLSYLGDALIGSNVNIGAGTITANYDGVQKHETIIEDRASTGSGTVLVAPVRLGKDAVTGAGAVVAKSQDVPDGVTVVGVPAQPLVRNEITKKSCKNRDNKVKTVRI